MKVYFDKENCINYLKKCNDTVLGTDTLRMLKRQLSVHLNFDIDLLDEHEKILLEEFQTGVDVKFKLTQGFDKILRPLKRSSFPSNDDIYLLNNEDVAKIKNQNLILIGALDEEIDCLSRLIINDDYSFHLEKIIGRDITPDKNLDILNLPFSTLVIIDRYMFKGPVTGGNIGLFDYNLDKFLKKIFINKNSPSRLIFVYQVKINVPIDNILYDKGPDLVKIANKIKKVIPKNCSTPEIFLIGVPAGYIDDEHDRFLISNYLRIKSGDSFVYFLSNGEIKTDSKTVDFYSLAYRQYRDGNKLIIDKINNIINETLEKFPQYSKVPLDTKKNEVINFI